MTDVGVYDKILDRLRAGAEMLPHAFLISGASAELRRSFALDFAQIMLAKNELDSRKIQDGNYEDLVWVRRIGAEIVTEQIEVLQSALSRKPYYAERVMAVIEDGDRMNLTSQNKLLKTLEEPAPGTLILILAEVPDRLAATIRSRCYEISLPETAPAFSAEIYADARVILSEALFTDAPVATIFEHLDKYVTKKPAGKKKPVEIDIFAPAEKAGKRAVSAEEQIPEQEADAEKLVYAMICFIRDLSVGSRAEALLWQEGNRDIVNRLRPSDEGLLRKCLYRAYDANKALTRNMNKKNCLRNMVLQFRQEAVNDKSSERRV